MPITTGNTPKGLSGMADNWMAGAVKHPGALRAKAKRAGLVSGDNPLSAHALSVLGKSESGTTRKQVALARTFKAAHHNEGGCAYHAGDGVAFPRHSH